MSEEASQVEQYQQTSGRVRRRATQIFLVALLVCAGVVLPPFINIGRYQRQITALMTRSLGRPVRLSSVNLRLLPRPGFVLNNLSVGEAPEFGVEPMLSAETVVAPIRLSALLTGKVEVDHISLDNASLNLVQTSPGRWNIDKIMTGSLVQGMTGTAPTAPQPVFRRQPAAFPYLEAKNSRVNFKRGLEKLPYSLTDTQLSFWQESPGVWRLRLRGQPARTDMDISAGDTGDLRMEATLQTLPGRSLYQMPLKVQAAWREAQLGQLSRLLLGSDQGWRGDLTADLSLQGTLDSAQTEARLRATSVRREEFVPATSMDLDIHCGLLYQHTAHAIRNLACNTAIGDGKLALQADLPGSTGQPQATLNVDGLPMQAGLDMLRTIRDGFAPNLSADGKVSGQLVLNAAQPVATPKPAKVSKLGTHTTASAKPGANPPTPAQSTLQGDLTITNGALRGGSLHHPITLPKIVLTATELPLTTPGAPTAAPTGALTTHFPISFAAPAGNKPENAPAHAPEARAQDLTVRLQLTADGYEVATNGSAPPERLRELAYALGLPHSPALDTLSGGQADLDTIAGGPWLVPSLASSELNTAATAAPQPTTNAHPASAATQPRKPSPSKSALLSLPFPGSSDQLTGTIHLHRAAWTAPYLANPVAFPDATLTFSGKTASVTGSFTYGALTGTAYVSEIGCTQSDCLPQIEIHLADTDAATIEGALLGAPEKKSLLSPLIDRVRNSQHAPWPEASVKLAAENLILGPVTLHKPLLALRLTGKELTIDSWQANLLGGDAKGTGSSAWNGNQLAYTLEGSFSNLSGTQLGQLLDHPTPAPAAKPTASQKDADKDQSGDKQDEVSAPAANQSSTAALWTGGPVDGSGKIELSGLTAKELASSTTGTLHFHWANGTIPVVQASSIPAQATAAPSTAKTGTSSPAKPSTLAANFTALAFASWAGDATIGSGKISLGSNTVTGSPHEKAPGSVFGYIPFGGPAQLSKSAKPSQPDAAPNSPAKP